MYIGVGLTVENPQGLTGGYLKQRNFQKAKVEGELFPNNPKAFQQFVRLCFRLSQGGSFSRQPKAFQQVVRLWASRGVSSLGKKFI